MNHGNQLQEEEMLEWKVPDPEVILIAAFILSAVKNWLKEISVEKMWNKIKVSNRSKYIDN